MNEKMIKIPDDVFETRCRWCVHRIREENQPVDFDRIWRASYRDELPCRIIGIARCNDIPGECTSFHPNEIYGICGTCEHDSMFCDGFCRRREQPNKRQLFIGQGYANPEYWGKHYLSTCDNYEVRSSLVDRMRRQAAEGKIPKNFDPETMQPTETMDTTRWAGLDRQIVEEKKQREREKVFKEAERVNQIPGQQMMDI